MLAAAQPDPSKFPLRSLHPLQSLSRCWHHTAGQVQIFIATMPTAELLGLRMATNKQRPWGGGVGPVVTSEGRDIECRVCLCVPLLKPKSRSCEDLSSYSCLHPFWTRAGIPPLAP